jgi:hypothetical protein
MEPISPHCYKYNGTIVCLAPGTYDENNEGDILQKLIAAVNRSKQPPSLDERKREKITQIKSNAGRIINATYPEWKQRNLSVRALELVDKKLQSTLTTEEQAELEDIKAVWSWVKSVREASNVAEASIDAALDESALDAVTVNWPQ